MFRPAVLATGAAIGILSSVIPYRLELESLRRMPMRLFGVWMSLEPAVAALIGLVLLGQHLSVVEWLAIGCVMVACAGARVQPGATPGAPDRGATLPQAPAGRRSTIRACPSIESRVAAWTRPVLGRRRSRCGGSRWPGSSPTR